MLLLSQKSTVTPEGTARHSHIRLTTITDLAFVCLTHERGLKFRDVISARRYSETCFETEGQYQLGLHNNIP